jgi:hypothetical protein
MEMFTIQRNFNADRSACKAHGVKLPLNCKKLELYQAIAAHLGIDTTGIDDHVQLMDMIDDRNVELACKGIGETFVEKQATVLDKMAANINRKPILRCDRKPLPKPIKRNAKPVIRYVSPGNTMAKALMAANLIEVV